MLEIKGLRVSLEGKNGTVEILRDINLKLEDHKLYVLTGPNGGGKSTLAKAIMGIYPAASGEVLLNGRDISSHSITERALAGIGYAFQQPPRFKGLTVGKMLEIASGKDRTCNDCNFLYKVGLCPQDYIAREVDTSLSGGEVKRIEIATLLARDLKVAIYDEPEAGIDLWSFSRLIETFNDLHEQYDTTIILISHQERIINLADEIILVADGVIKHKGTKDEIWPLIMQDSACSCRTGCDERVVENA
ncbi:ABC transporter ATP-binding protein [Pelotomaculum propionicicum]|uniref:ABC transporter ATP-binding protein n=1 Tax=Pelotomaculum propionicicum TaxID=258475 RepID=UPI003B7791F0